MARLSFISAMKRVSPPWLRRAVGGAFMEGLGVPVEAVLDRSVEGLRKRFPDAGSPEALGYIGRERRILRGPAESAATYARRLVTWLDAHRLRGGPYALLAQLHAFFRDSLNVQIDVVANSGTRHVASPDGTISRDAIAWNGDGAYPTKWARVFIVFRLETPTVPAPLTTEDGTIIVTESGDTILADKSIYSLGESDKATLCAVPREWSAAHIDRVYITLMHGTGDLWGYPEGGIWDAGSPAPGPNVWGEDLPVQFVC